MEWRVGGERSPRPILSGRGFPLNFLGSILLKCLPKPIAISSPSSMESRDAIDRSGCLKLHRLGCIDAVYKFAIPGNRHTIEFNPCSVSVKNSIDRSSSKILAMLRTMIFEQA